MLKHIKFGFGHFVHIKELVIGTSNDSSILSIDEQSSCFGSLLIPLLIVECLSGEIERGNAAVFLFSDVLILAHLINHFHHIKFLLSISSYLRFFLGLKHGVLNIYRMETICIQHNHSQIAAKLNTAFQIETTLGKFDRQITSVSMTENLISVGSCHTIKSLSHIDIITISTNTTNHLLSCQFSHIFRNKTQTSMSYENSLFMILVISTLTKLPIQHSSNLSIKPPRLKLTASYLFKLRGFASATM